MNWENVVCFQSLLILLLSWGVFATLYTRCNSLSGVAYKQEPLFTGTCKTLMEANTQCLKCSLCDLISKTGTQCSFHTAIDRTVTCGTGGMYSGTVSKAKFRSCNCTLLEHHWVEAGPFYQYITPNTYQCNEGQDVCRVLGGIMAEFYSIDELNYALAYISEDVYVGAQHIQNNQYAWITTGQDILTSLWVPGQPEEGYPCVQIWRQENGIDDCLLGPSYRRKILCQKRIQ